MLYVVILNNFIYQAKLLLFTTSLMRITVTIALLSTLLLNGCGVFAQPQFNVKHYTTDNGLPHNIGYGLLQDRKGYIWIGTDDGLARFDGKSFKVYRTDDGLLSNYIIDIVEDRQGVLWLGSWKGGVNCIKDDSVFTPTLNKPLFRVAYIAKDKNQLFLSDLGNTVRHYTLNKNQWLNRPSGLVYLTHDTTLTYAQKKQTKKLINVLNVQIHLASDGTPLFFGKFPGVWQYQNDQIFTPFCSNIIRNDSITHLSQDTQGRYWLGTQGKILIIDAQKQLDKTYHHLPNESIYSIKVASSGVIYFLTNYHKFSHRGFYSYNPTTQELTDLKKALKLKTTPVAIEIDKEDNVWLTTNGDGVYCISPSLFQHYDQKDGLPNVFIRNVKEDNAGNIYVGTIDGLVRYQNGKFVNQQVLDHSSRYQVLRMFLDRRHNVLTSVAPSELNTSNNIFLYKVAHKTSTKLYNASFYNPSYVDQQNRLWSFTNKSIFWYPYPKKSPFKVPYYYFKKGLIVSQIFEHEGQHWLASNQGLLAFDTHKRPNLRFLDTLNTRQGLISNDVNVVKKAPDGALWIGTKTGLCRLKNGQITCFTQAKDGLIHNNCTQLEFDRYNRLWIGTLQGLSCFDGQSFINYSHKTGLIASDINCLFADSKQKLWVGTSKGISVLDIRASLKRIPLAKVYIDQLLLNDVPQEIHSTLRVNYPSNLKIYFNALSYTYPKGIRYQYRLNKGKWKNVPQQVIEYNAFEQGNYIIEIRAKKFNSGWSLPKNILLIVRPPMWLTWWAISLYIIVGLFMMWGVIRWRSATLVKEKLKLEQVVVQRTYELAQQKEEIASQAEKLKVLNQVQSNFFSGISHELRTPLTLIVEPAEKLLQYNQEEPGKRYTQTILGNAQRLLRLINQLMDFSKLESGKMTLQLSNNSLYQLLVEVIASFELLAQQKNIELKLTASNQALHYKFDHDKVEKVVFNLISNALKFTPTQGNIEVHLWQSPDEVKITVTDTGIGIAPADLPFVFDRFYQVDGSTTKNYPGTGIGLALVKELVELHEGSIEVTSQENKGSTFVVKFPFTSVSASEGISVVIDTPLYGTPVASTPLANASPEPGSQPGTINLPTVLVTEDNSELRQFIASELIGTYRVIEATNGAEGIERAIKQLPDLIITDIMMPQTDGFELVNTLRNNPATSHIPIIILSAKASPESKLKGLEIGSDDYLTKPFSSKELLLKVRNIIGRKEKLWQVFQQSLTKPNLPIEPSQVTATSMDEALLQKALEIVEVHLNNTAFDVTLFCQEMGMSRSSLHQKLKALTNMSTTEFIRSIRLKRAASLIQQQSGRIEEIAFQTGFNDVSYFNRCFKKQFGMTPKKYQQPNT
ncbi:two-component system sensor histidine kinase/response regulator, hybrid, putative [Microscilla marina ATCC 23134]|uniref:histidine kinase n=2 Tax=Microscilla marina TaxID=1027 RepID=A1ZGA7_MICM2|nr:two-component system sensor histidine kinase/response regulator, hybrid, putative [Microscilla marina ATCC 23134]